MSLIYKTMVLCYYEVFQDKNSLQIVEGITF